jgi:ATP-binding cassette subfamily B protein
MALPGSGVNILIPKIIAHRLNTIESADEIFFVNTGKIVRAGSFDEALNLLMHGKNES